MFFVIVGGYFYRYMGWLEVGGDDGGVGYWGIFFLLMIFKGLFVVFVMNLWIFV